MLSIILLGPQGCGKTTVADALRKILPDLGIADYTIRESNAPHPLFIESVVDDDEWSTQQRKRSER